MSALVRNGWTRKTINVGDTVTVQGVRRPSRTGIPGANAQAVVLGRRPQGPFSGVNNRCTAAPRPGPARFARRDGASSRLKPEAHGAVFWPGVRRVKLPQPSGGSALFAARRASHWLGQSRQPDKQPCRPTPKGPVPRLPDGTVDLSGVWVGGGPINDLEAEGGLPEGDARRSCCCHQAKALMADSAT